MGLRDLLLHRDFEVLTRNPPAHLIFPPKWPEGHRRLLYSSLFSYGFRTFLKDLILHRRCFTVADLTRYCSEASAREYLGQLRTRKLVRKEKGEAYSLTRAGSVVSFGETLEWFVAKVFHCELGCEAWWNVVLKGETCGGDYDVLAECENRLIYVEVKSGPPKSIELENIRAYLNRINDLRPDAAIFFEDTTLKMRDKILPHFRQEIKSRGTAGAWVQVKGETYRFGNLFLTNSKPGVLENLRLCLSSFLRGQGLRF